MTSPARIEANRRNAQKSTGPKSVEGKRRSCLNALDHGLRSEQVVLPTEDQGAFDAHLAAFVADWQPSTATRMHLVKRAAVATWRLDRCVRVESGRLSKRVQTAFNQWDMTRAAATKRSMERLEVDPARAVRELESNREGVARLSEIWQRLAVAANEPGGWNDVLQHHRTFFLVQGLHPEDAGDLGDELLRFLLAYAPDLVEDSGLEPFDDGGAETIREALSNKIDHEINRLIDLWDALPDDLDARARHAELEAFAPQPEDAALLRYEAQFDREFRATINQLARLTRTGEDLIEPAEIASIEPEIPVAVEPEPVAPNEPKPEAPAPAPAPVAPNEPKAIVPIVPVPQVHRDRDGRIWSAVIAPAGSDLPQSVGWNR